MGADQHTDWERLWNCAGRLAASRGGAPHDVFGPIGLHLEDPARPYRWDYTTTPRDAVTFASTGSNGVHFSFLGRSDADPVAMTVPGSFDSPNRIVGAGLHEFLALGCRVGYRRLEGLAHGWSRRRLADQLDTGPTGLDAAETALLDVLVTEFGLRPWPEVGTRLDDLAGAYGRLLREPTGLRAPD